MGIAEDDDTDDPYAHVQVQAEDPSGTQYWEVYTTHEFDSCTEYNTSYWDDGYW